MSPEELKTVESGGKKLKVLQFDDFFTEVITEKTRSLKDKKMFLAFTCPKHIKKNTAAFLFNQKFNAYPIEIKSLAFRKKVKVRAKSRRETNVRLLKKFYFRLPENFKIEE